MFFLATGLLATGQFTFRYPEKATADAPATETLSSTLFQQQIKFPRDTSYTPYSTYQKLIKQYPGISIASPAPSAQIQCLTDVPYVTIENASLGPRKLLLDIYRPTYPGPHPAILMIHGGGWSSGDKRMQRPLAIELAKRGYVAVCVEYRLSPEAQYPAAIHDIRQAIRFVRQHHQAYDADPAKIALSGCSAGGHLAALTGLSAHSGKYSIAGEDTTVSTLVQAVIDIDGVLDFTHPAESGKDTDPTKISVGARWLGFTYAANPARWVEASPLTYADGKSPPMLFINSSIPRFHAGRDEVVQILKQHGIYAEIHTLAGSPHAFWLFHPWFDPTVDLMAGFLKKVFN
ncbi:MAG TPA: alpha/beta hydrolase [Phnomibacter sp.]|nr:alpha/beta hydrolase [Phnomibacter sp.]